MPLFEFICDECHTAFEELVRSASVTNEVTCPTCGSPQVRKQISSFASRLSGGSSSSISSYTSAPSCNTGST